MRVFSGLDGQGFIHGLASSFFRGHGFVAEDQIKLIHVARAISFRFCTLIASRSSFVTLVDL